MIYTRNQLAQKCGISSSKLKRILKALQIKPFGIGFNSKGLPIFYYQQGVLIQVQAYLDILKQRLQHKTKKCCICKQDIPQSAMVGNRCIDCYVQKNCKKLIYGKQWWLKNAQKPVIQKAIKYLSNFI